MFKILSFSSLLQVLKLSRTPNLIIIFFTQYCAAFFLVELGQSKWDIILDFNFFLLVLSTTIIAAAGYYINDYYDIKIDMINKPGKVIVGNKLNRRPVLIWHQIFNAIGIVVGVYVSIWVGLINLVAAFLLWFYSNQLKRLPLLGNITVAFLTALSLLIVAVYFRSGEFKIFIYAFFAFGITLIREIIKDMEDMKGDEAFGCKSLPIVLGIRKTKWILYILILGFTISLFYFASKIGNIAVTGYFLILLIPSLFLIYKLVKADAKHHFYQLSQYCKWLMIGGVLSMTIIN
ncbi:geranylgeranylglycerol-phosphate geranylgeranyltransferase [Reichenbachiella sp. MALMAid0571]|uniref:geranylgeranylglycerol-phosphate geranylgeranyltransferase n=1 Tax=Reichenbachiella sp. MALMAid0571 TaxID=3143939 RepID=UPI0032DFFB3E